MANTATSTELDEQTATDVATLHQLTEEIRERTTRVDELKALLRDRLPLGRTYTFAGRTVLDLAAPGAQFDAALAATVIPANLLPLVSTTKPDAALCRKILPADLYARCCKGKAAAVKTL